MISPVKVWRNQKYIRESFGKKGVIESYTLIRIPQEGFSDQAPYPVAIVRLDDKTRITVQIVDWDEVELQKGTMVEMVVRRVVSPDPDGVIPYGLKAKPIT